MANIKKINLGCGYDIKRGWINLDCVENKGVDIVHDLNQFPYPFEDNTFDIILLNHILEHLENPNVVIYELYRICKEGGQIFINTPHFSSWSVWGDITHKRGFNSTSLNHVDVKSKNKASLINKTPVLFNVHKRIIFLGLYKLFEPFVNIHNATRCFYERYLSRIFPADVLSWRLSPIKH